MSGSILSKLENFGYSVLFLSSDFDEVFICGQYGNYDSKKNKDENWVRRFSFKVTPNCFLEKLSIIDKKHSYKTSLSVKLDHHITVISTSFNSSSVNSLTRKDISNLFDIRLLNEIILHSIRLSSPYRSEFLYPKTLYLIP